MSWTVFYQGTTYLSLKITYIVWSLVVLQLIWECENQRIVVAIYVQDRVSKFIIEALITINSN